MSEADVKKCYFRQSPVLLVIVIFNEGYLEFFYLLHSLW